MAEWHFYAAGPSPVNKVQLWTTGTEAEKGIIREKIRIAVDWQQKNNKMTWVGAWMAGNYNAPTGERQYSPQEQVILIDR